ncbi:putative dehydrogenase [Virgibacillus natechei]|uniref:Dehydrogenase n=1 Tax=Virgibacillus natechei TaxID=1216297 RepID=A0ABS4IC81_9BACI|nr:Gfo/Idh/MocA family oxidoreductase [Virgibacillus natechei]MBP1968552.1 putative dehydrogenase [Virgibacillus natechei]UZD13666.1 Gfo/Idh/MocA family oxidoreductase [Virgibacillus natechei]
MKFSTIGTSWITESFIKAAKHSGKASLSSIYSRSEETAKEFADKNQADNWYTDLDLMLEEDTEFIYIASPNSMHVEHILKCIENKKHVFCEKPMAITEEQLNVVTIQAKKQGVFIFEGYRHLFTPNYQTLKDALPQVGQVRSVLLQYIQYSSRYDMYKQGNVPNILSKEFAGGALMDLGVYPLSMAVDLFGEPKEVDYFPVLLSNGIDGSGTLIVTYEDFNVTIMCSKIAQGTISSEIHGEKGTLTMDHLAPIQSLELYDLKSKETQELAKPQSDLDMVYEVEAFVKMIEENDNAYHDWLLERSRHVVSGLEKARKKQGILFPGE